MAFNPIVVTVLLLIHLIIVAQTMEDSGYESDPDGHGVTMNESSEYMYNDQGT